MLILLFQVWAVLQGLLKLWPVYEAQTSLPYAAHWRIEGMSQFLESHNCIQSLMFHSSKCLEDRCFTERFFVLYISTVYASDR